MIPIYSAGFTIISLVTSVCLGGSSFVAFASSSVSNLVEELPVATTCTFVTCSAVDDTDSGFSLVCVSVAGIFVVCSGLAVVFSGICDAACSDGTEVGSDVADCEVGGACEVDGFEVVVVGNSPGFMVSSE